MRSPKLLIGPATLALSFVLPSLVLTSCSGKKPSPQLATPAFAASRLTGKNVYFTVAAATYLKKHWSDFKEASDASNLTKAFAAVQQNPSAWRALDRQQHFDALLLTGDPASFKRLLDHVASSPDWTLTYLDHTSIVYEHAPAKAWTPSDLDALTAKFQDHPKWEQVEVLVQVAHRLNALHEFATEKAVADQAVSLDSNSAAAWTELANYQAAIGKWDKCKKAADQAIAADKHYVPALLAKASALYAYGKFDEAYSITHELVETHPNDGQLLFEHAKIAHAAHAFADEIKALKKVVAITEAASLPTGSFRIYLAQAYASDGDGSLALKEFEAALQQPDLTGAERSFAQKGVDRLRPSDQRQ